MTGFEYFYLFLRPFHLALHQEVHHRLLKITKAYSDRPHILDVGGRKSHYTIGIPGDITVADLPRETKIQEKLHLGINEQSIHQTSARRSNIRQIIFDDMTHSHLPDHHFDCVVAVEVLEHVGEDRLFLKQVNRVLKPCGRFLMTTPNGDWVKNRNPDHKRHYHRNDLKALLLENFQEVKVDYAIRGGIFHSRGLRSWSAGHPLRTLVTMSSNWVNRVQSQRPALKDQPQNTHHLIAEARK